VRKGESGGRRIPLLPLRWWLVSLLLVASGPPSGFADLDVQAKNGLLTLRVRAVPLTDVLQSVSRQTGLKVVYEGPRPSHLITANIEAMPEVEALSRLLEGLGVNYAYHADTSGRRVEMLIVSGSPASGTSAPPSQARSQAPAFMGRGVETPEFDAMPAAGEDQDDSLDPADAEPAASPGVGGQTPPAPIPYSGSASGSGELAPPSFPSQASYPPPLPFFPPNASYPSRDQRPF